MDKETEEMLTREAERETDFNRTVVIDKPQPSGMFSPGRSAESTTDFNRTVVIDAPKRRKGMESTAFRKITAPFRRKKQEIEDILGKMDISDYTSVEPDTSSQLTAPLGNLDTKYSVLDEVAQGGHATVSIARDRNLRRIVAIKSLKEESAKNEGRVESFISEAKVTAQLDHPSIIPIYGLTSDGKNGVHLVMKLVNGKTLRDYLRNLVLNYRVRGIDKFDEDALLRKRLELFLRACDAIAYAHHRNIMHRDLKPENIMIGEYMEVYVMDWGLARMIPGKDEKPSDAKQIAGTPRYFPPEALRGERCDERADIFTLGLILQEIVTLQFAVGGKDEKEYMDRIMCGELEPIRHRFKRRIDRPLQAIIRKATAYRAEERYQSVTEMAEDLRRYMGGLPISALPDDFLTKTARRLSRHGKLFLTVVMLLIAGSAVLTAYAISRQLESSREMNAQRRAMNFVFNRTAVVAGHIDVTTLHIQEQLSALARISAYLLSYNNTPIDAGDSVPGFHPPMDKMKSNEPGSFYSEFYKRLVNLDAGIWTVAPKADMAECMNFMHRVAPARTKRKNIARGSRSGYSFAKEDYGKLKAEYLYKGFPIQSVFIGSTSGAKLLYPWRGNYSRNIDPRERVWYRNALDKNGPVWGKPYMDIDSVSGLLIPCSIRIFDLDGNFRGVAGLDLSINHLTNMILTRGNVGDYVIEKAVINPAGEVLFSTRSEYFNKTFDPDKYHQNAEFKMPLFANGEIRDRILKHDNKLGLFSVMQGDQKIVCSFAYLDILDMYYLVTADYQKLLEHVRKLEE